MLNNKTFLKVISLIAAILLWVYVMVDVDPEKSAKVSVSVSFTNEEALAEKGLAALHDGDMTVSATVKGKRSRVNSIRETGLSAYVDVSGCKKGNNKEEIVMYSSEGITIDGLSDEYLQFKVEELVEEEKPLQVVFIGESNRNAGAGKIPWVLEKDPEEVYALGAESAVKKVKYIKASIPVEKLSEKEGKWFQLSVKAVDKKGREVPGVTVADSEYINARAMLLSSKSVEIDASAINLTEDMELGEIEGADKIKIVGFDEALENTDKIKATIDLEGISDLGEHEAEMNLQLPYGIYLYNDENPLTVKVKLKAVQ